MVEYIDCIQRSEEWFQARLGHVTGTGFKEVLNKKTGRKTYMLKLLGERMTGIPAYSYHNKFMEDGIETEPLARESYEIFTNTEVVQVGFVKSAEWVGCSPDGLIDDDGMLETKCPIPSTHCRYILDNRFPSVYRSQVQGNLWVTGRKWCDFISYVPEMQNQQLWRIRVKRDEAYIDEIAAETKFFLKELAALEQRIRKPF